MKRALNQTKCSTCVIAGGVAANQRLRDCLDLALPGIKLLFPDLSYCTDNAAMISYLGELKFRAGEKGSLNFGVQPNLKLA